MMKLVISLLSLELLFQLHNKDIVTHMAIAR
jgi:hypothetical protein